MQALVYSDVREVTMQDVPEPIPARDQALIHVTGAGICGSDMTGFLGHSARRRPPLILGHEVIGTVAQMPKGGEWQYQLGDRVVPNPLQSCRDCENCRNGPGNTCSNSQPIR